MLLIISLNLHKTSSRTNLYLEPVILRISDIFFMSTYIIDQKFFHYTSFTIPAFIVHNFNLIETTYELI